MNHQEFAEEWISAWNSHNLERILSHYSEDIVVVSPFIERVLGAGQTSVHGKEALRHYWGTALGQYTNLKFELLQVFTGVDSIVLYYRSSISNLLAAELMRFNSQGKVCEVYANYAF